jgi:amino acid adenylation domain-containing protein
MLRQLVQGQRLVRSPMACHVGLEPPKYPGAIRRGDGMAQGKMSRETVGLAASTQRQFWLLQQLQPETTAYNIACQLDVRGTLDLAALLDALGDVAGRHATLRTTFEQRTDGLLQCVHQSPPIDFRCDDVTPDDWGHYIDTALRCRFDLKARPPWQMRVARSAPDQHTLLWTMHHTLVDLATKQRFSAELAEYYRRRVKAAGSLRTERDDSPDPTRSLSETSLIDFAHEEAEFTNSEAHARAKAHFVAHLRGRSTQLTLPEDTVRPPYRPLHGARVAFDLTSDVGARLNERCAEMVSRPFLWLLTAWGLTLARFSASDHVIVGVPFSNRRNWRSKHLAGCFVRTLPVVIDAPGDIGFAPLLARVRATMLEHHRHQEFDPSPLFTELGLPRDSSRNPIYQAGFTFEPPMQLELEGTQVLGIKPHCGGTQLDVFLTMWPTPSGFSGQLEYATEIFSQASAERLVDGFLTLLDDSLEAQAATEKPSHQLRVLSENERRKIVVSFNDTAVNYAGPSRMHHLFLDQARRHPDALAVRLDGQRATYGELMAKARGLAILLRERAVRPGDHVGVYMFRSREMVLAILAILMSGGTYLPLDPDYPGSRIGQMLEDARPGLVLTHDAATALWPTSAIPLLRISFDDCAVAFDDVPDETLPNDAAYTIFTSGSTGRPKGATNTHRGIVNRILWMQDAFKLQPSDIVLQKTPFSFDVSAWEFFWPLAVGATLQIAPPGAHRDPGLLCRLIQETEVSTLHFVPSMLDAFLSHPQARNCVSLRKIFASGEALSAELVRRCTSMLEAELHNLYGPTEAAVDVTWWPCNEAPVPPQIPIGKPIANTQAYILDPHGNPVPIGVQGELYVGGIQVAVGYVRRPELTAERFLPDPFSSGAGNRLYRTGDLARWLPNGNIVYLGRTDFQVKLHGNRIELGEIEAVLQRCRGVQSAIVLAIATSPDQHALVAYLHRTDPTEAESDLISAARSRLAATLPAYMVPAHFVVLDALPLTASGKIDRRALPAPTSALMRGSTVTSPSTPMQAWLAEQIQELVGTSQVAPTANLFEIGGSSITVARLVGRVFERWGLEVPLVRFFEHPTIDQMADYLSQQQEGEDGAKNRFSDARSKARRKREHVLALQRTRQ